MTHVGNIALLTFEDHPKPQTQNHKPFCVGLPVSFRRAAGALAAIGSLSGSAKAKPRPLQLLSDIVITVVLVSSLHTLVFDS